MSKKNNRLTKTEIIDDLFRRFDEHIPKKQIAAIYDEIAAQILDLVKDGSKYPLGRIGQFEIAETAARKARNPRTGEPIDVPAGQRLRFKPSQYAKREVNR